MVKDQVQIWLDSSYCTRHRVSASIARAILSVTQLILAEAIPHFLQELHLTMDCPGMNLCVNDLEYL